MTDIVSWSSLKYTQCERDMIHRPDYTRQTLTDFPGCVQTCGYIYLKIIRKVSLKMFLKRKLSIDGDNESSANIVNCDLIDILKKGQYRMSSCKEILEIK